jgi:hypothetical protein
VAATATAGTLIHTASSTATDEVYVWATNTDTSVRTITIEWGGVSSPDDLICMAVSLPASSPPICLVPGLRVAGGVVIRAFADSANKVLITGNVNRIT